MKIKLAFAFIFLLSAQVDAQDSAFVYFNQIVAGPLYGTRGAATIQVTTVHGVRWKRWSAGIGGGYDRYQKWHVVPVLVHGSYAPVLSRQRALELQLNVGTSWARRINNTEDFYIYREDRGHMIHPAISYSLRAGQWRIYFIAGYKFQRLNYERSSRWWQQSPFREYVTRNSERLTVQLGLGWH